MTDCDKMDCPNRGKLVIDANVIRYVLGGTIDIVGQTHVGKSWTQKLPEVQTSLTFCLDLIKRCSDDGRLYVSDLVWSQELDINRLGESAHPVNRSDSVYTKGQLGMLREIIHSHVDVRIDVTQAEITEFCQLMVSHGCRLDDYDASLMLVACKLAQTESRSILISDDPDFLEPWHMLVKLNNFSLQGNTYKSDKLVLRSYADFVTLAHDCCSCSSDRYRALFNAWLFPLVERKITKMRQSGRNNLFRRVLSATNAMEISLQCKPM
jgi:hypothetical protein